MEEKEESEESEEMEESEENVEKTIADEKVLISPRNHQGLVCLV